MSPGIFCEWAAEYPRQASSPEVENLIKELYREDASIGDGGTADAIRMEISTGIDVSGRSHVRKGKERLRQIKKILQKNPDHPDRILLKQLADDLKDALGGN